MQSPKIIAITGQFPQWIFLVKFNFLLTIFEFIWFSFCFSSFWYIKGFKYSGRRKGGKERNKKRKLEVEKDSSSVQFNSVIQSCLTLWDPMDARLFCPSPTPGGCSNSCPLSRWWTPTISSSVVPFSSCLQSFPASGSFLMSQFFASGGQSIGTSASASNEYSALTSFRINWLDLLEVQGTLKSLP